MQREVTKPITLFKWGRKMITIGNWTATVFSERSEFQAKKKWILAQPLSFLFAGTYCMRTRISEKRESIDIICNSEWSPFFLNLLRFAPFKFIDKEKIWLACVRALTSASK